MNTSEERQTHAEKSVERRRVQISTAIHFKDKGLSNVAIAEKMKLSESTVRTLLATIVSSDNHDDIEIPPNDDHEMVIFDRYISEPEKLAIAKEFVGNMPDKLFDRYKVLPFERKAYLLRLYAEKHHNINLDIGPHTS